MSEALPDHWGTTSIEKSAYLRGRIGWQGLRADEFIEDGPYLVTGTDFKDGKIDWSTCYHVTEARYREAAPIQLRDDDLLVTKDGTIGKVAHVSDCPNQAVLNSGVFLLRCSDGSFRQRWLYHLLTSSHFEKFLRQNLAGSTINHLYQYVFEKYEFPVPQSDEEQKKLCKIIDLIDTQIEATEALIAKQERLRAGLMQDLFTRGVDENGELRPPRDVAPHLFHETELGWLPKGWKVNRITRCQASASDSVIGPFGSNLVAADYRVSGSPVIFVRDLKPNKFIWKSDVFLDDGKAVELNAHKSQAGDVLATKMGFPPCVAAVHPKDFPPAIITADMIRLRVSNHSLAIPSFVAALLNGEIVQAQVRGITGGVTRPKVTLADFRSLRIPFPSIEEQARLMAMIGEAGRLIDEEAGRLDKLRLQKTGLMQDLLTGTVSVQPLLEKASA